MKLENENLNEPQNPQLNIGAVRASVCGYCGRLLGGNNYPEPIMQGIDFEIPEDAEKVEGSCCISRERLGSF